MRSALVTGVSGGIGTAVADLLSAAGWTVLGIDRSAEGPGVCDRFLSFDLARWRELDAAVEAFVAGAPLDLLVNNAGVQHVQSVVDVDNDALEDTFAVNTFAPFAATRALAGSLSERSGSIVNIFGPT